MNDISEKALFEKYSCETVRRSSGEDNLKSEVPM